MMSNTFAGINPGNAIQFAVAEVIGAFIGLTLYKLLSADPNQSNPDI